MKYLSSIEKKTYKNDQLRANLCVKCRIISQFVPIVKVAVDSNESNENASTLNGASDSCEWIFKSASQKAKTNNKRCNSI